MKQHTPGPWYAKEGMIASEADPSGQTIATCNDEANARLIAAAPDLLHACHELLKLVYESQGYIRVNILGKLIIKMTHEAIAKAEGHSETQ